MSKTADNKIYRNVTCPFCGLLCDDLIIKNTAGSLTIQAKGCSKAVRLFERNEPNTSPMIHGENVTLSDAVQHAASILAEAKNPLLAGGSTDVAGCRELVALAERSGAILDHAHGDAMTINVRVLQNSGWILTTLTELKNRADLIIFIGTDGATRYPRFFERFIWDQASLAGLKKNAREIFYLGNELDTRPGRNPRGARPVNIRCTRKELNERLNTLRALIAGTGIEPGSVPARKLNRLNKLVEKIKHAHYGVIVWDAAEFPSQEGDITVQLISDMLRDLNRHQRFAGLPLGGSDGSNTFSNVCSWQSGFPLRVSYRRGFPEHDAYANCTGRIVETRGTDALLWLSSFDTGLVMPRANVPTIALSRPSLRASHDVEVFIPVGTPGIDHRGNLIRADNVVSLPLGKLRDRGLPGAAEVLKNIREKI